jgi:hypothetical protein
MSVQPGTPTTNKKWRIDLDLDLVGYSGNWAQIKGLNNIGTPVNNTVQDATDYDDDEWGSDAVTGRKWQLTGSAFRKQYAGSYDPAQEALRAAADNLDLVHVRWYERGVTGGEAYEGFALVQWEPQGGDPTGLSSASFTLLGQGGRTPITNPSGADVKPIVNSVLPNTGPAAGGTNVTVRGSGFSGLVAGATAVKFGATNATEYTIVSDAVLVAKAPAHAAGEVRVIATNAIGASDETSGDKFTYV